MKKILSLVLAFVMLLSLCSFVCADDYEEITPGSTGAPVKDMQKRLEDLGYGPIGIDGAYGDGTTKFVKEFQERNGLEATGVATVDTLKLLYSDDAKSPFHPPVEILRVRTGNRGYISFTFQNNTDQPIDSIIWYSLAYDKSGKYFDYSFNNDYAYGSYHSNSFAPVKPGETYKIEGNYYNYSNNIQDVKVCIKSYHTTDGYDYAYDIDQLYFISSDENIETVIIEASPDKMSDEELNRARTCVFGYNSYRIMKEAATSYLLSDGGQWVFRVDEASTFDKAGLKKNDLITTIDGTNILNGHAIEKAKLKILDGERVTLAYVRSNKQYETTLALDMDALLEEQNAEKADNSEQAAFMDELLQLADLYKTGLLTDEEFAAAKQKLLGN